MYNIIYTRTAKKQLLDLPPLFAKKAIRAIELLAENPYPRGCKKLEGADNYYRIEARPYRIVYEVINSHLIVNVIRIQHRKDVYRNL